MRIRWMDVAAVALFWWATSGQVVSVQAVPIEGPGHDVDDSRQIGAKVIRFNELMTEKELRSDIDRWRVATENLYLARYDKKLSITVEAEASGFLVNQYANRDLNAVFSENPQLSRFVIRRDLGAVMNTAFVERVRDRYKTWAAFLASDGTAVPITVKNVARALELQDCNVIPCPPNKCKPDCSGNSFKRFSQ